MIRNANNTRSKNRKFKRVKYIGWFKSVENSILTVQTKYLHIFIYGYIYVLLLLLLYCRYGLPIVIWYGSCVEFNYSPHTLRFYVCPCYSCVNVFDTHNFQQHTESEVDIAQMENKTRNQMANTTMYTTACVSRSLLFFSLYVYICQWYLLRLVKTYLFSMLELNYKSDVLTMIQWMPFFYYTFSLFGTCSI